MATMTDQKERKVGVEREREGMSLATPGDRGEGAATLLSSEQVWAEIDKASFAVLSYETPSGEPRSAGVLCKTVGRRLYVAVAPDSWKARHISASGRVAVTVPVRRGGILSLVVPIPPATVSFHGTAIVHPAGSAGVRPLLEKLGSLLPPERQDSSAIIEVIPEGTFVTYGVGVSLSKMRDPLAARARVPVTQSARR